jgi:hypothetical protein
MRYLVAVCVACVVVPSARGELIPVAEMRGATFYQFVNIAPATPGTIGKTLTFFYASGVVELDARFFQFGPINFMNRFTVVDFQAGVGQNVYTLAWDFDMRIADQEFGTLGTLNLGKVVATGIVRDNATFRMELFASIPSGVVTPGTGYDMSPFTQGALFSGELDFFTRTSPPTTLDINTYVASEVKSQTAAAILRFRLRAIPEPSALGLLTTGILAIGLFRFSRRRLSRSH